MTAPPIAEPPMPTITSLAQLDRGRTYSYADYLGWKFTEMVELLQGRLFPMSAPLEVHQRISWNLGLELGKALEGKPCRAYTAPFDVRLPDRQKVAAGDDDIHTVVQPDLCVVCDLAKLDRRGCLGAPDLVVEILSPGNSEREMGQKYDLYEEAGVREYWIVQPDNRSVLRFALNEAGQFVGLRPVAHGEPLTSAIFPGLSLPTEKIFAE
jgi:Uma2 family endonuclease